MQSIVIIILSIAVWWGTARFLRNRGRGRLVRHLSGMAVGFIALVVGLAAFVPDIGQVKKGAGAIAAKTPEPAKPGQHATSNASALTPAEEIIKVSVLKLFKDYEANEVAADSKYKGRHLLVSGTVKSIDKDAFDNIVIRLKTQNEFLSAIAHLDAEFEAMAASLSKGTKIVWECEGNGLFIGSPVLKDCSPA